MARNFQKTYHAIGNVCKLTNNIWFVDNKYVQEEKEFLEETSFQTGKRFQKRFELATNK